MSEINSQQKSQLEPLKNFEADDVINLCKVSFDYLIKGSITDQENICEYFVQKYKESQTTETEINHESIQHLISTLIWLLINVTKTNLPPDKLQQDLEKIGFSSSTIDILLQFVRSKRGLIETCLRTFQLRAYHLVDLDWRLEVRVASRALMRQNQVSVTMKLYLHTESKTKNRYLLHDSPSTDQEKQFKEDNRNRKNILMQTDLSTLTYMIHTLEEALMESRTRRIRNIVKAIS